VANLATCQGLLSGAIDEFLLGSNWFVKNKAKWDFAAGTISLSDKLIHTLNKVCPRILVSEDCTIPAKHEANVPVKKQDDGNPHPPSDWAIEPRRLELSLIAASTHASILLWMVQCDCASTIADSMVLRPRISFRYPKSTLVLTRLMVVSSFRPVTSGGVIGRPK